MGLGPALGLTPRIRQFEFIFLGKAVVSNDGSNLEQAEMTFALPTKGLHLMDRSSSSVRERGLFELGRSPKRNQLDAKMSISLGVQRLAAREQNFYGLGPNSNLSGQATYGLMSTESYAEINNPVTSWNSVGFRFSFITPRVTSSVNNGVPQIGSIYNDGTAPGLGSRQDFLRYEPYVVFHVPPHRSYSTDVRVGYAFYQDTTSSLFSFQRLSAKSTTIIPLWFPSHGTPDNRSRIANAVCPSLRSGLRCSLGNVTVSGWVTASYADAHSQIPFYLDPTLGGTDINGDDTLRGFADYRFRAPNDLLFQVEYRRPIWGPFGLLTFYDAGKVELRPTDISFDDMRQDFGIGFYLRAGNHEVVRFYVGFGTGEPYTLKAKFPNSF